jgi:hypothetical protein
MLCQRVPSVRARSPMKASSSHILSAMHPIVRRMVLSLGQSDPSLSRMYPMLSLRSPMIPLNAPKLGLRM